MSEQDKIDLYKRLSEAMKRSTKAMLERKAKLGENVVIADANGKPISISAEDSLQIFTQTAQ